MAPKNKKSKFVWRNSKAKAMLRDDFVTGELPLGDNEMTAAEIFGSRPEYSTTEWKLFPDRMRGLRKATRERMKEADEDATALEHDLLIYPPSEFEIEGNYKWHGSMAEALLKEDIEEIVADDRQADPEVTPSYLWFERIEYQLFEPEKFANHFYQAFKRVKFDNFVNEQKEQRKKKMQKEDDK